MYRGNENKPLYRSRNGRIFGVCQGLADYFEVRVFYVRVAAVLLALFTGGWPIVIAYIVAGVLMKPEPMVPLHNEEEREFYDAYAHSRKMALLRLKNTYENLERRIRRMEDVVTSREYDWDKRFNG